MQRWCPEPLVPEPQAGSFQPLAAAVEAPAAAGFRPETGFADSRGLLTQLSRSERAEVVELLEQDLRREFEERAQAETAAREAAATAAQAAEQAALARWREELADGLQQQARDTFAALARRTAEVALLMASKIVRREVAQDPQILVRTLETVLYKVDAGCELAVTVHPDDAAWLDAAPETCRRLRIGEVKSDRRLERGGCLVQAADAEWDATIDRQLAVLAEALEEVLATPAPSEPAPATAPPAPREPDHA